ncbi:hypothetical protein BDR03DRAFT_1019870, partial [Suillus americanus]
MFFMNVVSHPQRSEPFGERALLLYAARVRRDWHDTLALDNAFDISVFNTTLLKNLAEENAEHLLTISFSFPLSHPSPAFTALLFASTYAPFFRFRSLLPASCFLLPLTCFLLPLPLTRFLSPAAMHLLPLARCFAPASPYPLSPSCFLPPTTQLGTSPWPRYQSDRSPKPSFSWQCHRRATDVSPTPHLTATKLVPPRDPLDLVQDPPHATHQDACHLVPHLQTASVPAKTPSGHLRTNTLFREAQHLPATMPALSASAVSHTTSTSAKATFSGTTRPLHPVEEVQRVVLSMPKGCSSATTGSAQMDAQAPAKTTSTSARDAETRITALRSALEARKCKALTPYHANTWLQLLNKS